MKREKRTEKVLTSNCFLVLAFGERALCKKGEGLGDVPAEWQDGQASVLRRERKKEKEKNDKRRKMETRRGMALRDERGSDAWTLFIFPD